jgi:hypothetical protein
MMLPDGTKVPNRRPDDTCEIWAAHPSLAEQMWNLLIKRYIDLGEWEIKLENGVMDYMKLEYVADTNDGTPFVATCKDNDGNVTKVIHRKRSQLRGNKG